MKKELNETSFRDWVSEELQSLNTPTLVAVLNIMFNTKNYPDDTILPLNEETVNDMYHNPYEAVVAFSGCDTNADYFQLDNGHCITTLHDRDIEDMVDDYIDDLISCCEQFAGSFDPYDYDIEGRILYLVENNPEMFSERTLEYAQNNDFSDFSVSSYENYNDDCDFVSEFEEYVDEQLEGEDEEDDE